MAAATPFEWRPRFPTRGVRNLTWYLVVAGAVTAVVWLLFGAEPSRLPSGEVNPLARLPTLTAALAGLGMLPLAVALIRRPRIGADHYALHLRPGIGRTLLLPWAAVTELATTTVAGGPLLMVRLRPGDQPGDRPHWYDRGVLRWAGTAAAGYDLAVRLDEFAGSPADCLAALADWAPTRVTIRPGD